MHGRLDRDMASTSGARRLGLRGAPQLQCGYGTFGGGKIAALIGNRAGQLGHLTNLSINNFLNFVDAPLCFVK